MYPRGSVRGPFAAFLLLFLLLCKPGSLDASPPAALATRNVVLVTVDGLRPLELFSGLDPLLLADEKKSGVENLERLRSRYWREDPKARREALLPFFWKTLAPKGIVLGNGALGSRALLKNQLRFSYPGYAELLTGSVQTDVTSNDKVRIKTPTILDFARERLDLDRTQVAAFASWEVFAFFTSHTEDGIFSNAGYERMPRGTCTPEMASLDELQEIMLTPWDTVRHDAVTAGLALGYLKTYRPRVLYLALGETDDWAHERRYDRVIAAAGLFDETLADLWRTLQSMDAYRDRTTLIITTDHGRGRTAEDWTDHGEKVEGAEDIWIAVIGPDTPDRGEAGPAPTVYLSNVAATVLYYLGLDPAEYSERADPALPSLSPLFRSTAETQRTRGEESRIHLKERDGEPSGNLGDKSILVLGS